jgi:hypothetical protein
MYSKWFFRKSHFPNFSETQYLMNTWYTQSRYLMRVAMSFENNRMSSIMSVPFVGGIWVQ